MFKMAVEGIFYFMKDNIGRFFSNAGTIAVKLFPVFLHFVLA